MVHFCIIYEEKNDSIPLYYSFDHSVGGATAAYYPNEKTVAETVLGQLSEMKEITYWKSNPGKIIAITGGTGVAVYGLSSGLSLIPKVGRIASLKDWLKTVPFAHVWTWTSEADKLDLIARYADEVSKASCAVDVASTTVNVGGKIGSKLLWATGIGVLIDLAFEAYFAKEVEAGTFGDEYLTENGIKDFADLPAVEKERILKRNPELRRFIANMHDTAANQLSCEYEKIKPSIKKMNCNNGSLSSVTFENDKSITTYSVSKNRPQLTESVLDNGKITKKDFYYFDSSNNNLQYVDHISPSPKTQTSTASEILNNPEEFEKYSRKVNNIHLLNRLCDNSNLGQKIKEKTTEGESPNSTNKALFQKSIAY